jgi:D-sedoheptulose 7-phosphate isomerase
LVAEHFRRSCETLSRAAEDADLRAAIHAIAEVITDAFRAGHKLLIAGNGGSAADAQHIAGEFLSRLNFDRNPLPAIALTTDTSVLTEIGNDYGFERVFERQVRGLGKPGDVFIAISTSGRSPNVVAALKAAHEGGLTTIGFTGTAANGTIFLLRKKKTRPSTDARSWRKVDVQRLPMNLHLWRGNSRHHGLIGPTQCMVQRCASQGISAHAISLFSINQIDWPSVAFLSARK